MALKTGTVINGTYKVLHKIDSGGMSDVYLVLNERANREWAVKEVKKSGGDGTGSYKQGLIAETGILKKLRHKYLPEIIDIYDMEDTYLVFMEYVEGNTLRTKLVEEGPQRQEDVVEWAKQLCDVFGYLHAQNPPIIYRDTKPSNIMLRPNGTIVLIDFGTAREFKEGSEEDTQWLGTPGYAAPEQFGGHGQTDERTDIYNLGATLYHLVTGKNPCRPPYEILPIRKWNEDLSSGLDKIIAKCTQSDPDNRYQNMAELLYDLEHYRELEDEYIRSRRKRVRLTVAAGILSGAMIGTGLFTGNYAENLSANNYSSNILAAKSAETPEIAADHYKTAIRLAPERAEAYEGLITEAYLSDDVFSKEEAEELTSIMGSRAGGSTAEEALSAIPNEYGEVAYQTGLAYFYYYEGEGNKQMSLPWFQKALGNDSLEDKQRDRATRLGRIAAYYQELNRKNKAGDISTTYKDFWNDMKELTAGNIVISDNVKTALVMYREMTSQINMRAYELKQAGIGEEELLEELSRIDSRLTSDLPDGSLDDADKIVVEEIKQSIEQGRDSITTVFHGTETERS